MEDFLKFPPTVGVIFVEILKEVSKNNKSKKAQNKRPIPSAPSPVEVDPDVIPIPEFWGGGSRALDEPLQSILMEQPALKPTSRKKKKEEVSVTISIASSSAQDKRNTRQGSHYDYPKPVGEEDFSIHSVEEVRRVTIWEEILQRKY